MPLPPWIIKSLPDQWSPECWSPEYILNRIRTTVYWKTHPNLPWLTADANRILLNVVQPHFQVLEFGSGRSTRFFARYCAAVTTVEHDERWIEKIRDMNLSNVTLIQATQETYASCADQVDDDSCDLILIDGLDRLGCLSRSIPKLKAGGTLILDNANRYIPNQSPGPDSLRDYDDNNPEHRQARSLEKALDSWPKTWTSNGITDSLLLSKP